MSIVNNYFYRKVTSGVALLEKFYVLQWDSLSTSITLIGNLKVPSYLC